jgi:hypothetical protein
MNDVDHNELKKYYIVLIELLLIEDSFRIHRYEWILGVPQPNFTQS